MHIPATSWTLVFSFTEIIENVEFSNIEFWWVPTFGSFSGVLVGTTKQVLKFFNFFWSRLNSL